MQENQLSPLEIALQANSYKIKVWDTKKIHLTLPSHFLIDLLQFKLLKAADSNRHMNIITTMKLTLVPIKINFTKLQKKSLKILIKINLHLFLMQREELMTLK